MRVGRCRAIWRISSVGRASALQAEGHRFEPCILHLESLAQLVEHLICNQRVGRSNRLVGICGSSSVVEHHLAMVGVAGSNPVFRFLKVMPGWRNWQTHRT